jgi:hypothetical protein
MKKGGFYFTEGMPKGGIRPEPGITDPDAWKPYKIWSSDLWECQGCGAEILSGFGLSPISIQHMEGFEKERERIGADQFQVNDC